MTTKTYMLHVLNKGKKDIHVAWGEMHCEMRENAFCASFKGELCLLGVSSLFASFLRV